MGATHYADTRTRTLDRMLALLSQAADHHAEVVLFPELALTTFFPRHLIHDPDELSSFFEKGDIIQSPSTAPLFSRARDLRLDISLGFAEQTLSGERFNTSIYYHSATNAILSKYRKIHLPGEYEPFADPNATQQLEKRYFQPGDLGFSAFRVPDLAEKSEPIFGMMICNDRRWPEAWRCLGLQGVEVVLCGYNTAGFAPDLRGGDRGQDPRVAEEMALFQHRLSMQAGAYQNSTFAVCAARCGVDDGKFSLIGGSCIVDPEGRVIAEAKTKEDEVVVAECDLGVCTRGKTKTFNCEKHRRVEHYGRIVEQTGVVEPAKLNTPNDRTPSRTAPLIPSIPSPPPIRILLINPNSTPTLTSLIHKLTLPTLPASTTLTPFTAPAPSPPSISSFSDNILSTTTTLPLLRPLLSRSPHDALLIACYSSHALIRAAREQFDLPVAGILEASLYAARMLGGRFGVIATSGRSRIGIEDEVRALGLEGFCVGVEACGVGVLELEAGERGEVLRRVGAAAGRLVGFGAEVVALGCAGMSGLMGDVEAVVGEGVVVVDGVVAGVQFLSGLVRMGARTAKGGLFAYPAGVRKECL